MQKKHYLFVLVLLFGTSTFNLKAQSDNDSFTPFGKPLVLVFTNVNTSFSKNGNSKAFDLTRAYLGYEYFFSENISSRINIDVGDPGVGKLQMTAFIKNAYLQYKKDGFSARIGMIGTDQFNIQEKQWGYRYIRKSFQDEFNFGSSADLGMGIDYSPADFISVDISVLNGEGYKRLQSDSTFKTTAGLTIKPFTGLVLRGYIDRMKNNYAQTSYALYTGYSTKKFRAGIEYNIQKNNGMTNNHDFSGVSVYTSLNLAHAFSIFTRYDYLWSETLVPEPNPWNYGKDGQIIMGGFDYLPAKGVKIAPTYLGWSPRDKTRPFTSTLALYFEIKF